MARPHTQVSKRNGDVDPLPVLILEDERFDRHRLARMCSALPFDCEVSNATTLESFTTELEREIFGLILLDYTLPDGTGIDALEVLRLSPRNMNAPTLMISGREDAALAQEVYAAGCAALLSKDQLTSTKFALAVSDALGPQDAALAPDAQVFDRDVVAGLLGKTTQRNARDIKPMVSRMMRQLRGIRAHASEEEGVALQAIEQNCMSMWSFLIEMERRDGASLLQDVQPAPEMQLAQPKPRKPPSPFSRLNH